MHHERSNEAYALYLHAELAARRESPDCAFAADHYQQALVLAEELGMRPLQAHCHSGLGRLYSQTGRGAQARAALTIAITLYRAMDMTSGCRRPKRLWLPERSAASLADRRSVGGVLPAPPTWYTSQSPIPRWRPRS